MKNLLIFLLFFGGGCFAQPYSILLHGGAGNGITEANIDSAAQYQYRKKMEEALKAGAACLDTGGTAEAAVVAVISVLEDSPLFNAGRGAVFTWDETNEMDASIMRGSDLNAGAIAGVTHLRNPITAARAVMNHSPHVLLYGEGAQQFARQQGLVTEDTGYFKTRRRLDYLRRFKQSQGYYSEENWEATKMGTVGCVVLDGKGNLAAGTSTGGMTGKRYGRIGDSPLIGAGTYANNQSCAVSCTGHGEYFIRYAVAHDMHARMQYGEQSGAAAAEDIIQRVLLPNGGSGGLIALTAQGEIVAEFNTQGMFRAYLREGEAPVIALFAKDGGF